jgi:F0F1-type ATP synthase assembly protein I
MPKCPKCGSEVDEKMAFCPKCGTALRMEQPPPSREEWRTKRREWRERRREERRQSMQAEKREKEEKWEKREKHEFTFLGPLIGGLVLIILGAFLYFWIVGGLGTELLGAVLLVIVGVIIIGFAVYSIVVAERRHPRP